MGRRFKFGKVFYLLAIAPQWGIIKPKHLMGTLNVYEYRKIAKLLHLTIIRKIKIEAKKVFLFT